MNGIQVLRIKEILPLFKGEEQANAVELIKLEGNDFDLVSKKGIHKVGDNVVYIQPDYCVSDNSLFGEFIAPDGDTSKSYLGKVEGKPARIKAKSFNLSKTPNGKKIYSNGILLPLIAVQEFLNVTYGSHHYSVTDEKLLGVYKYQEPLDENANTASFPFGWYKTDEENINNVWNDLKFPVILLGTEKIDGSSITISYNHICLRNLEIKRYINKVVGKRKRTLWEKLTFQKPDLNVYEKIESDNPFIRIGKKYQDLLIELNLKNYVLRGELYGKGVSKGSGSKLNLYKDKEPDIRFFGIDIIENGVPVKLDYSEFLYKADVLKLPVVPVLFEDEFKSKEELVEKCENIFENFKNMEGLVIRDENGFSAKYMNNYYDSKK